ncbi:MAG TPA: hypothetical protein VFS19_03030, partial [Planctomycetota bacterium]|nr:hypothetical protein [Planctomycetota bacterium]
MFALLVASLLLQAKPTAAELVKSVEEKYASATSFSCTMDGMLNAQGGGKFSQESWSGQFKSKGDGQARAELTTVTDAAKTTVTTLVSDGKNMAIWTDKNPAQKRAVIAGIGPWTRRFQSRVGVAGFMRTAVAALFKVKSLKLDALYKVGSLADAGTEKVGSVECRV